MPELLVMRHGKSDWSAGFATDFDRPLNNRGRRSGQQMAEWLEDQDLEPDLIVSSPAIRARDTAAYVARLFEMSDEMELLDELYHADSATWFEILCQQSVSRLLVCGHNPGLDDLVESLADDDVEFTADGKLMTTAAIAHFDVPGAWGSISRGSAQLRTLVRPKDL